MSRTCGGGGGCCCGGCCGKRGATIFFALVGILLAAAVIGPPVYVHETDQDYKKLFPILSYGRKYLKNVTDKHYAANQYKIPYPMDEVAASTIQEAETQDVHGNQQDLNVNFPSRHKLDQNKAGDAYK